METTNETGVWEGTPSQLTNFGTYLACATLIEPFFPRMLGLADIVLSSSDRRTPLLVLHAVPNGLALRKQIRANVERPRVQKSVRQVDFAPER